jgi:hypothetical protein
MQYNQNITTGLIRFILELEMKFYFSQLDPRIFEGDILVTPDVTEKLKELQSSVSNATKRNAIRNRKGLWITKIIPYELEEKLKGTFLTCVCMQKK